MLDKLRLRLATALNIAAMIVIPRELRPIAATFVHMLRTMPDEIGSGREGGVVMVPWYLTEDGKALSEYQMERIRVEAANARALWEGERTTLNGARGVEQ